MARETARRRFRTPLMDPAQSISRAGGPTDPERLDHDYPHTRSCQRWKQMPKSIRRADEPGDDDNRRSVVWPINGDLESFAWRNHHGPARRVRHRESEEEGSGDEHGAECRRVSEAGQCIREAFD